MCCLLTLLVFVGPRLTIAVWWLAAMDRWEAAFDSFLLPFLGFLFLPWTTLMYVVVAPSGRVSGFDWFFLGIAVLVDIAGYSGSAYGNRDRITRTPRVGY